MFEIINETEEKIEELKVVDKLLRDVVKKEKLENAIFNVIIIDNERIHAINKQYRGVDRPTDVISFALEDNEDINMDFRILGDIYISLDKVYEQSNSYGHSFLRELSFLTIHGLLHLRQELDS
jgi:probable rRNA maturation factor